MIATDAEFAALLPRLESVDRVAIDTEADSLHCYFEKLCLLQFSLPGEDFLVDPLATIDLHPLAAALQNKEIVLQGADFDLRLMRRSFDFVATRIFDTVIAARILGIREFSLAALVERYFGVKLTKGSQKANWAQRPLPSRMAEYAVNDTHYLLPMAEKLEDEMRQLGRLDWFVQSCVRGLEMASIERTRAEDEVWRIGGAGALRGQDAAVLRALWQWREAEAQAVDRPPFHILQNKQLITAAQDFAAGNAPDFHYFSPRRRRTFREAADTAMQLPESEWPVRPRRTGTRPTAEMERRSEELRKKRDAAAQELGIESSFIAPRSALDNIAADAGQAEALLVPWQKQILGL